MKCFIWLLLGFTVLNNAYHIRKVPFKNHFLKMSDISPITTSVFSKLGDVANTGGAGGSSTLDGLKNLDKAWNDLKNGGWRREPIKVVVAGKGSSVENVSQRYDVVVCGGTLGIFYARAMQNLGMKVCVIERGRVAGRAQEWNISRKEIDALLRLGILQDDDIKSIIGIEFNPVRVGFKTDTSPESLTTGYEVYVEDILNLGIKPDALIELVKQRFLNGGGEIEEFSSISSITTYEDSAIVSFGSKSPTSDTETQKKISARVVIDSMGNGSPISRQIRGPVEPDGICVVVGSCARGFNAENNTYSDVIYTDTPLTRKSDSQLQYFWEAFPSGSGKHDRTTYLFTYMDAKPQRPSILEIMEDYWELLPRYQGKGVDDLEFLRVLYGMFPTYRESPIQTPFDRILQVGDASGIQSPLSFGGFGSLTRHIERITSGLKEALDEDLLTAEYLSKINSYQPNLSACWMFQRAMSVPIGGQPRETLVTDTLTNSFTSMEKLGDATMRPFLQDVLQFNGLLRTLLLAGIKDPLTPFKIVPHVGIVAMLDFFKHFSAMGWYILLAHSFGDRVMALSRWRRLSAGARFSLRRKAEAWKFGSGLDYYDH